MMGYFRIKAFLVVLVGLLSTVFSWGQTISLDEFEKTEGWYFIQSDGVDLQLSTEKGRSGKAIRFDYDFTQGTGYGGIQKLFPIDLPENYEFTFWLKAQSPSNNFEIKFADSSGNNVWWVSNRNYAFPGEWKKITIKKRHIGFAWGPTNDQNLKRIDRIEFTIASFVGGKGTIWLDDFKFEPLPIQPKTFPNPNISASTSASSHHPLLMIDGMKSTFWQSETSENQTVIVDFKARREFGGIQIDWTEKAQAQHYKILLSNDQNNWEKTYEVSDNQSNLSFIRLAEAEARYVKIELSKPANHQYFGVSGLRFLDIQESLKANDFFIYAAKNSPKGFYPRSFLEQASYWTIVGVNNDTKEALINEDGLVEVDKGLFSLEPMIKQGDSLWNWSHVKASQNLGKKDKNRGFSFMPTVEWECGSIGFQTRVTTSGEAQKNSLLHIDYSFENRSDQPIDFDFYLLIRPFQANPYYQFLNLEGGVGKISHIAERKGFIEVDGKIVYSLRKPDGFGASHFDEGNLVNHILENSLPAKNEVTDAHHLAQGLMKYHIHLDANARETFQVVVPFYGKAGLENLTLETAREDVEKSNDFWSSKVSSIEFQLPASADRIVNTYKSNLVYILINRDKAGIQPGSRSYERSWIRDGALTSSALLKSGIVTEVKDYIDWYVGYQYENGKVPCVVDGRGPDPVPENDSHGELIYLVREYFNFTHDTAFLKSKNQHVLLAVDYIQQLIDERSTDFYRLGNDSLKSLYGLVTESISHEGYSAKPMHSYWDNFFTMKGLKDAAEIQKILGETENYERIVKIRDTFKANLYQSINLAMNNHKIEYIPGCAELGDFDATSTTIALTPCNELLNLPKPQVYNTFDKYYGFFTDRRDGKRDWVNYTPYENRLIGSFIMLDQPQRAHELIDFFLSDQRPQGWNHWAEVVWNDERIPRYIGDMPHTWVGSDFINAVRSMFVYENEFDESLVLGAALYQDWIDAPEGMAVRNLPTYYGPISYSIEKQGNQYEWNITGPVNLPANGMKIKNFNSSTMPKKVFVDGVEIKDFSQSEIQIKTIPAKVVITY